MEKKKGKRYIANNTYHSGDMAFLGKTIQARNQSLNEWHDFTRILVARHAERQRDALGIGLGGETADKSKSS